MCNAPVTAQRTQLAINLLLIGFALIAIGVIALFAYAYTCGALMNLLPVEEGGSNSRFALVVRISGVVYLVCLVLAGIGISLILGALAILLKGRSG
jgi:hypothetical protein